MTYSVGFKAKFANEFARLPAADQDKILEFVEVFERCGLGDFAKFAGKIAPSWAGNPNKAEYLYAQQNDLWHYHVGIPAYTSVHSKYLTSDWVLHFQWRQRGAHIDLVDLYAHYRRDGTFYLPGVDYLAD